MNASRVGRALQRASIVVVTMRSDVLNVRYSGYTRRLFGSQWGYLHLCAQSALSDGSMGRPVSSCSGSPRHAHDPNAL